MKVLARNALYKKQITCWTNSEAYGNDDEGTETETMLPTQRIPIWPKYIEDQTIKSSNPELKNSRSRYYMFMTQYAVS